MFARSLITRSVAPVLAAVLAMTAMPGIASAQERPERENRGERMRMERPGMPAGQPQQQVPQQMQRVEVPRSVEMPRQVYQGQVYQQQPRGDVQQRAQGWDNRPQWGNVDRGRNWQSERVQAQAQAQAQAPAQARLQDRTGDRGQWGRPDQDRGERPNWQSRNPAYTDANRNPAYQPQVQQDRRVDNDRRDDRGAQWSRNDQNRWGRGDQRGGDQRGWDQRGWDQRAWQGNRGDWDRNRAWNGNRSYYSGNRNAYGNNGNYRQWNNDWRRDRRYDWYSYRNSNRNFFRGGFYGAPFRGYSYSRLGIGIFLGSAFYDQRYWINNPGYYHLPPHYGSYRWVRYYDDAILVDIYTGEVVDAIYDFYW